MRNYTIHNTTKGTVVGVYTATSIDDAYEVMAKLFGYKDYHIMPVGVFGDDELLSLPDDESEKVAMKTGISMAEYMRGAGKLAS